MDKGCRWSGFFIETSALSTFVNFFVASGGALRPGRTFFGGICSKVQIGSLIFFWGQKLDILITWNLFVLYFGASTLQKEGRTSNQNRGPHLGSRNVDVEPQWPLFFEGPVPSKHDRTSKENKGPGLGSRYILLMAEILHHLRCMKPHK